MQDTRHALLIPFFEGILEGKNKEVNIIDGNEFAYFNFAPSQFLESAEFLKKSTVELMKSDKAKLEAEKITVAQPLYYDGLMATLPAFEKGYDNVTKWKWLEENTRYAMATSDSYTWFYSQKIIWWQNKINDTLVQILQNSKAALGLNTSFKNKGNLLKPVLANSTVINEEKGYYYYIDPKTPMKTGTVAFTFKWNSADKNLLINFADKIPDSVMVYANDISSQINNPRKTVVNIKLDKFNNGKIMILAKYGTKLQASGIQVYNN